MWLILVDAHSKWLKIIDFEFSTKAPWLIKEFKKSCARFGLPVHCVTDGGPQFRIAEFHNFLDNQG